MTNFTKVDGMMTYPNLKEAKKGDLLVEGIYLGSSPSKNYPNSVTQKFKPADGGATVGISGGHLNYLIDENVAKGQLVQVFYNGQEKLDKGPFKGNLSHQFEVAVAQSEDQLQGSEPAKVQSDSANVDLSDLD